MQDKYDAVNDELTDIKAVYPPKDFSSRTELENWLLANDISEKPTTTTAESWIARALELQQDALNDGFVVSMDYDYDSSEDLYYVYCTTIVNGSIYYWDPETDEIHQETLLASVK